MSRPGVYRPSSSNRSFLVILLCVAGSFLVHGVAYGVLRAIRKPARKERKSDDIFKKKEPPKPKKLRKVKLRKPMARPRVAPMTDPMHQRRVRRVRRVRRTSPMKPMARPMEPPMRQVINLTGAGVNENLTSKNGVGSVYTGDTAEGDPTVDPMRPRPRPRPMVVVMRPRPRPMRPRPRPVYVKTLPQRLTVPRVPYPRAARRAQIEGTVKLRVTVGKNGRVLAVKVIKRLGYGLDEAAVRALKRARFKPAVGSHGKPMVYTIIYKYTFRLEQ